ncbi:MAG: Hsp70 family protein [Synergistaceae bacterium]|nr:Hsp70 family protein [Synergistaceae bacterium]
MTALNLNVSVGIDAGSVSSKLAYSDNLGTRILAEVEGFDAVSLREEAEIFFDEPVYSCVVAVNETMNSRQRDKLRTSANLSGFRDVEIIGSNEAMILELDDDARTLVCDFGASRSSFTVLEDSEILDSVDVDVCGNMFDKIFADYLAERKMIKKVDGKILREARRIKHILSENTSRLWHSVNIFREDFERLIYFPVKRASHTFNKIKKVWKPERIILTGGCSKIPVVREFFVEAEIFEGLIAKGASLRALSMTKQGTRKNISDNASRIRELRAEILGIEELLTRAQKDRLYMMFRQVEGANDSGIISIMENLVREIKNA